MILLTLIPTIWTGERSEGWDLIGTHPLCFDGTLQTYSYHHHAMLPISEQSTKQEQQIEER